MMNNPKPISEFLVPGKRAHLVGIGGVSMCPLAEVLAGKGLLVQGSDMTESDSVKHLRSKGISVAIGHNAENLGDCDFVIRTAAVHDGNPEIAGAIAYANRFQLADVLIVGRGGGSIEDLWPFNEEVVARAIYASDIPVISAVGHEPDVTISDLVADRRASTPSNAAELAVPDQAELRRKLQMLAERMCKSQQHKIDGYDRRLRELQRKRVLTDPMAFLQDRSMQLDLTQERLVSAMERVIDRNTRRFTHAAASLDAMSPLRVLRRGYCVAQKADKTLLRSSTQAERGENIFLRLAEGSLQCQVMKRGEEHEESNL